MACNESSVAAGRRFNVPVASEHVSVVGVANLAPPPQRCSTFHSGIALIEDLLRFSPYGDFVFAAQTTELGLSWPREQ